MPVWTVSHSWAPTCILEQLGNVGVLTDPSTLLGTSSATQLRIMVASIPSHSSCDRSQERLPSQRIGWVRSTSKICDARRPLSDETTS